jgi:hypothetical protein
MLQRGIAIKTLDSSYVSSLSWYFLNMLGLQGLVALILGGASEGSDAKMMQQQMQGQVSDTLHVRSRITVISSLTLFPMPFVLSSCAQLMPGQPQQPDLGPMIDAERNEVEITKSNFLVPAVEKRLLAERRAAVAPRFAPAPKPQQY